MEKTEIEKLIVNSYEDIVQIAWCPYVSDASGALKSGAVLLAIAENKEKKDNEQDPFYCLIGLPSGVEITPYLSNFFG